MSLSRVVDAELLDHLTADDPAALRSRMDLRRVHRAMGTCSILQRALKDHSRVRRSASLRILELGAGDGSLMLRVANALSPAWLPVELTLLDRQPLVSRETIASYASLGWRAVATAGDALDWAAAPGDAFLADQAAGHWDLIVTNLFLHHFDGGQLAALLRAVATTCEGFVACEPRRTWPALAASHLIGAIGVNAVTKADAVTSVHAGFRASELTSLWPGSKRDWLLQEYAAGPFSHCFRAERIEAS